MDAKLTWKHALSFTGVANTGVEIPMDTVLEHGGSGEGATPMELILMGVGGCTAMDVMSILQKRRLEISNFEIVLHADRAAEHPKVFTDITIEYVITGKGIDQESVERAIDLSENKYCSGMAMMRKAANIKTSYRIIEG